jgi:hypothetical protein
MLQVEKKQPVTGKLLRSYIVLMWMLHRHGLCQNFAKPAGGHGVDLVPLPSDSRDVSLGSLKGMRFRLNLLDRQMESAGFEATRDKLGLRRISIAITSIWPEILGCGQCCPKNVRVALSVVNPDEC